MTRNNSQSVLAALIGLFFGAIALVFVAAILASIIAVFFVSLIGIVVVPVFAFLGVGGLSGLEYLFVWLLCVVLFVVLAS